MIAPCIKCHQTRITPENQGVIVHINFLENKTESLEE